MSHRHKYDAVIVGSGPNGLASAITLASAGLSVHIIEARDTPGGGARTQELTLPGFRHDVCSAIHPLALASPFFRGLPLRDFGVKWIVPPASLAHPFDDGSASLVYPSVSRTAERFGKDCWTWKTLFGILSARYEHVVEDMLAPLRFPKHPMLYTACATLYASPSMLLGKALFREKRTRAVFAGMAGHSVMPLEKPTTGAFGVLLTLLAHAVGWPVAQGGSQSISDALVAILRQKGGSIEYGRTVASLEELPPARTILFDTSPQTLLKIAGTRLPSNYRAQLKRYRYNPGVFKIDWALKGPIPWKNRDILESATAHLGGTAEEIAASERACWKGVHTEKPYVLLSQPTLFDPTRAPTGMHTAWAYCHVPNGSTTDRTEVIERQVERFAPGFRDLIMARSTMNSRDMEAYNPNYVGGDINGGVQDLVQAFMRPARKLNPYRTGTPGIYVCSSSTPPGGGVHGMCGWHAAQTVLKDLKIAHAHSHPA